MPHRKGNAMWIFLKDAFLSIAAAGPDPDKLMVRARFRADIHRVFPDAKIIATPKRDYPFRAFLDRGYVGSVISSALQKIDYAKFKPQVPLKEPERHDAYMDVWGILYNWQTGKTGKPGIFGMDWPVNSPRRPYFARALPPRAFTEDVPPWDLIPGNLPAEPTACQNKTNRRNRRR